MTKVTIEKQYRAVFQAANPLTSDKHPILLISVGQPYHEQGKLLAVIELLNRSGFAKCTIMLADTLQRHNCIELSDDDAYRLALNRGDEWLQRNQCILDLLKIPYHVVRWDESLAEQSYCQPYRQQLMEYYQNDPSIKHQIDASIIGYLSRQNIGRSHPNYKRVLHQCLIYVMEECPILMPLWAKQGYDYIIYPKKMTPAMYFSYHYFVVDQFPGKVQWLNLRFRKKHAELGAISLGDEPCVYST